MGMESDRGSFENCLVVPWMLGEDLLHDQGGHWISRYKAKTSVNLCIQRPVTSEPGATHSFNTCEEVRARGLLRLKPVCAIY